MSDIDAKALKALLGEDVSGDLLRKLISASLTERKSVATPQQLRELAGRYHEAHVFKMGDLVRWKKGFKDRKLPLEEEPAIVLEVLATPIMDPQDDPGSPYFREPYDLRLGVVHPDGTFLAYYFNSRRFEAF